MQPPAITADEGSQKRSLVQPDAGKRKFLVTPLLHADVTYGEPTRPGATKGPAPRLPLMSVSEVARQLGVCSASVYALCAKGALRHVRVLNAIRVSPEDLEAFAKGRR